MKFNVVALTDLGLVRTTNEDSAFLGNQIVAVADGMGGHVGGEIASSLAVRAVGLIADEIVRDSESDPLELFNESVDLANAAIQQAIASESSLTGMGTTLTALFIYKQLVHLVHIGDSRCYRILDDSVEQITIDHTLIQEMLDQKKISEDEVATHPQRSVLTQAIMGVGELEPLKQSIPATLGDRYLLCSDGLNSVLSDMKIGKLVKKFDGEKLLNELLKATKMVGAPDNITLVLVEVVEAAQPPALRFIGAVNHD